MRNAPSWGCSAITSEPYRVSEHMYMILIAMHPVGLVLLQRQYSPYSVVMMQETAGNDIGT
jgi:hypothetical protein